MLILSLAKFLLSFIQDPTLSDLFLLDPNYFACPSLTSLIYWSYLSILPLTHSSLAFLVLICYVTLEVTPFCKIMVSSLAALISSGLVSKLIPAINAVEVCLEFGLIHIHSILS